MEKHMRVCLRPNTEKYPVLSMAPSEPILCEAARLVMQSCKFHPATLLATEFRRLHVKRGPCGETIIMKLVLILASDQFVSGGKPRPWSVVDFLEKLLNPSPDPPAQSGSGSLTSMVSSALPSIVHPTNKQKIKMQKKLGQAFRHAKMYISHFIKAGSSEVVDRNCLWALILRGAALECSNGQAGVNLIIPFVYMDEKLGRYTVSAIFIQAKNDIRYKHIPHIKLFDKMDPYTIRVFSSEDKDCKYGGPPIIRIVSALASPKPAVVNFLYESKDNSTAGMPDKVTHASRYTAYDFWCAGLSYNVWAPIKPGESRLWDALLHALGSKGVDYDLEDNTRQKLRRSQGVAQAGIKEKGHWSWIIREEDHKRDTIDVDE